MLGPPCPPWHNPPELSHNANAGFLSTSHHSLAALPGQGLAHGQALESAPSCTRCYSRVSTAVQDADLDLAAKNIIKGGYSYSGQRCTAVKVVLALEPIADELVKKVWLHIKDLTLTTVRTLAVVTALKRLFPHRCPLA